MNAISLAVEAVGGPVAAAKVCGVRRQAVDKWVTKGALPRTDYTGETRYAERLAAAAAARGQPFDASWLLAEAAPNKASPESAPARKVAPVADRRAQLAAEGRHGRRTTDPTDTDIQTLRECAEKASAVAGRLAG